ncbi:MAG: DUF3631 domain-containing protein [Gammaproteobacteria bacterium]
MNAATPQPLIGELVVHGSNAGVRACKAAQDSPEYRRACEEAGAEIVKRARFHKPHGPQAAAPQSAEAFDGAKILDAVYTFTGRFVAYPSEAAHVAHVLWVAHTHLMARWDSTPRIAFLSPEPGSGKSRALEATEPLVPFPVEAVNVSATYLFRKVGDQKGRPTILFDEIDTVFGPRAKENEELRGLLNAGHRKGAVAGRCVVRGKEVLTEELPAYSAVAIAGLGNLPETILSRSVIVKMRRRAPSERIEPYRRRINGPQGEAVKAQLVAWAASLGEIQLSDLPQGIEDRSADVWEALITVADIAGGTWPDRARAAAVELVADALQQTASLGVLLLTDLRAIFGDADRLQTENILSALHILPESPWANLRGSPLDARGLSYRLRPYGIRPMTFRDDHRTPRGYLRADFLDSWARYLPHAPLEKLKTSKTPKTSPDTVLDVSDVLGNSPRAREAEL